MATDPVSSLGAALSDWLALPIRALDDPSLVLLVFGFGSLHALLPGHGKALLAMRRAVAEGHQASRAVLMLDGIALATARVLMAFALVVGSVRAADALGIALPIENLRLLAGCILIGIGAHFAWHASRRPRALAAAFAQPAPDEPPAHARLHGTLKRSLLVLAMTPEPVALALASYGVMRNELPLAAIAGLSLALGMGTTLGLASMSMRTERPRIGVTMGIAIGIMIVASGAVVIADAR